MVRLTDHPDMTLDVYRGFKTTIQQPTIVGIFTFMSKKNSIEFLGLSEPKKS